QGPSLEAFGERFARDQLEYKVGHVTRLLEPVDGGDVGVIERRERLGLAAETRQPLRIARELGGGRLDRHLALEPPVPRAGRRPPAAAPERREDLVRADAATGGQWHGDRLAHCSG